MERLAIRAQRSSEARIILSTIVRVIYDAYNQMKEVITLYEVNLISMSVFYFTATFRQCDVCVAIYPMVRDYCVLYYYRTN